jgi:hypothetical protein
VAQPEKKKAKKQKEKQILYTFITAPLFDNAANLFARLANPRRIPIPRPFRRF